MIEHLAEKLRQKGVNTEHSIMKNSHSNTTKAPATTLAHNIRVLRRRKGYSQEVLAKRLQIKRSNIAAYESKNVEPRLKVILDMARLFDISLKAFIEEKISAEQSIPSFEPNLEVDGLDAGLVVDQTEIKDFIANSMKVRKILDGFKAFYGFKRTSMDIKNPEVEKLVYDIENFIQLLEHLLSHNESVIDIFKKVDAET